MKKKIILLAAALMLIATGVSASSLNGDYKGNPIVKVKSDGKSLETDEVPAMIYEGHTLVPISLLRQIGASVTWDQDNYSVNVQLPKNTTSQNDINKLAKSAKEFNNGVVSYTSAGNDFGGTVTFFYNGDLLGGGIYTGKEMTGLLQLSLQTDASIARIYDKNKNVLSVETKYVKDFYEGKMTSKELSDRYYLEKNAETPTIPSVPSASITPITIPKIDNTQQCNSILAQYEKDKAAAIEAQNRKGGLYSGGLEYQLKTLEEGKKSQLQALGCTQ